MIILIAGCSHTGKTLLAQSILERHHYPYLSIDHLKMGLIRSGATDLTPEDDGRLTQYLWPIVREIVKTAIENRQNLVVEGCYMPFDWKESFAPDYLKEIRYVCLIMTEEYIRNHMDAVISHADAVEQRLDGTYCTREMLLRENAANLEQCRLQGCPYVLLKDDYLVDISAVWDILEMDSYGYTADSSGNQP